MQKINEDFFKCILCQSIADVPYENQCCGKLYCQTCVSTYSNSNCNECLKRNVFRQNLFAQNLLKRISLPCKNNCGGKYDYEEMKTHLFRCEAKIFSCSINNCWFTGKRKDLIPHLMEFHPVHILLFMENYADFEETILNITKTDTAKVNSNIISQSNVLYLPGRRILEHNVSVPNTTESFGLGPASSLSPQFVHELNENNNHRLDQLMSSIRYLEHVRGRNGQQQADNSGTDHQDSGSNLTDEGGSEVNSIY